MQLAPFPHRAFLPRSFTYTNRVSRFLKCPAVKPARCYAASSASRASVYVSTSTSPLWNLSFEELLFRNPPTEGPLLLIYKNEACVVIGRNQNPWKEINQAALKASGIDFIRRRSGGGTVYHDVGNINFSLHLPRVSFDRKQGTRLVLQALKRLNVPDTWINERNDICVGQYKICRLSVSFPVHVAHDNCHAQYVSGSAYKIIGTRAYHHGTLLLEARLDLLGDVLRNTKHAMVGRSVASVRSPVRNISEIVDKPFTHDGFIEALTGTFASSYGVDGTVVSVGEELMDGAHPFEEAFINKSIQDLQTWEWKYGQTLEFVHPIHLEHQGTRISAVITAKHGIITKCDLTLQSGDTEPYDVVLAERLVGKRYGLLETSDFEAKHVGLIELLQREM